MRVARILSQRNLRITTGILTEILAAGRNVLAMSYDLASKLGRRN